MFQQRHEQQVQTMSLVDELTTLIGKSCRIDSLPTEYQNKFGKKLDYKQHDVSKLSGLLKKYEKHFVVEDPIVRPVEVKAVAHATPFAMQDNIRHSKKTKFCRQLEQKVYLYQMLLSKQLEENCIVKKAL